jgi:hypothetical protein
MEDIELVIKIPRAYYELVLERCKDPVLLNAFKNGIQLPRGHGDLIDVNTVDTRYSDPEVAEALNDAPTIIEADKERE